MKITIILINLFFIPLALSAFNDEKQIFLRAEMQEECQRNTKFLKANQHPLVKNIDFKIHCGEKFHHYNSQGAKKYYNKGTNALLDRKIKIAEFNALHPGMQKTRFKDFKKIAQIINQYDVIGITELIPVVSAGYINNNAMIKFITDTPQLIKEVKQKIFKLQKAIKTSIARGNNRGLATKKTNLALLKKKVNILQKDLKHAHKLYRYPGYLKILAALHEIKAGGTEWSLVLSPRGEGSETTPTLELVGYYYRSSKVKPKRNKYCQTFACTIEMDSDIFDEDKSDIFARRPFMAEFMSGKFSFALITSHVIFASPKNPFEQDRITSKAFGTSYYDHIKGATAANYARIAEIKVTLDFIEKFVATKGAQKDVIFMGDFNLEKRAKFWPEILKSWQGSQIYIDKKTSITKARFNIKGEDTFGASMNYDHFIFNPKQTKECMGAKNTFTGGVVNFTQKGIIHSQTKKEYGVTDGEYNVDQSKNEKIIAKFITPYETEKKQILTIGKREIDHNGKILKLRSIINDQIQVKKQIDYFQERIIDSQSNEDWYYYYFHQTLSDHFPIYMECSTI